MERTTDRGSECEKLLLRAIRDQLSAEFTLMNGLLPPTRSGDTDHVLVGPSGVFVLETKDVSGRVTAPNGRLLVNGKPLGNDMCRRLLWSALRIKQLVETECGLRRYVTALLVFPRAEFFFVKGFKLNNGVVCTDLRWLKRQITHRHRRLSPEDCEHIRAVLEARLPARYGPIGFS